MKIDLKKDSISCNVLFTDKEEIKELGFSWDKENKVWFRNKIRELCAVELEIIKKLEQNFIRRYQEDLEFQSEMESCRFEIY